MRAPKFVPDTGTMEEWSTTFDTLPGLSSGAWCGVEGCGVDLEYQESILDLLLCSFRVSLEEQC